MRAKADSAKAFSNCVSCIFPFTACGVPQRNRLFDTKNAVLPDFCLCIPVFDTCFTAHGKSSLSFSAKEKVCLLTGHFCAGGRSVLDSVLRVHEKKAPQAEPAALGYIEIDE